MAATPTRLMTLREFEQLPDPVRLRQELRHGEVFEMAPPKMDHAGVQRQLRRLLESAARRPGIVEKEVGFVAGNRNFRIADVAFISKTRWDAAKDYLEGAPELVIEVLSASNTVAEINDKEQICFENGCEEFWSVDPVFRVVKIATPDGRSMGYRRGQSIPLGLRNGAALSVDAIFDSLAD